MAPFCFLSYLTFTFLLLNQCTVFVTSQEEPCPVLDERCFCEFDGEFGDSINCDSLELIAVPEFEYSNYTWDSVLIRENLIVSLPDNSFENIKTRALYMSDNLIDSLGENVFTPLQDTLELLDFEENRITDAAVSSIRDLPLLSEIILDYNLLTELTEEQLTGLPSLLSLRLQFNDFVTFTQSYTINVPTLTRLDVYGNRLLNIEDDALSHLTDLEAIDLGINFLPEVPTPIFEGLNNLKFISLWANEITEIDADDLSTVSPSLESITVGNNEVSELPETLFGGFPNLLTLDFNLMNLASLPDRLFENNTQLFSIYMDGNSVSQIPSAFNAMSSLTYVRINENSITEIRGDEFITNPELYNLELRENAITMVNQSLFCNNNELDNLFLDSNLIREFDACAALTIQRLNVYLAGNPINCGCDILWLKQANALGAPELTVCAAPPALAGRPVSDIADEEFQCDLDQEEECANVCL